MDKKILVTGSCGFIGMHLSKSLLEDGYEVIGVDNLNNYYDPTLKVARLNLLSKYDNFDFEKIDIASYVDLEPVFKKFKFSKVVNLAAQAGVRYSLKNPHAYIHSNIVGFMNILELCREYNTGGLIYASSSSVYGGNNEIPFSEKQNIDKPLSIYAASKKSNELMAYSYSHLYGLKTTGLRFFTAYGPWGRPDMAMNIFSDRIIKNQPISVFNHGDMKRDFTYIDDIIAGVRASIDKNYDCEIFNLGKKSSEDLISMIHIIEDTLGIKAKINFKDIQPGDVKETCANIDYAKEKLDYNPLIPIESGIPKFIEWFKLHYNIN